MDFETRCQASSPKSNGQSYSSGCFKGETFNYSIVGEEIVIEYLYILNGDKFQEIVHIVIYKNNI